MLNAETPRLKFALYGAHSSLGNALLCELLSRQHEAVALVDDFNSMTARPGLRAKAGGLFNAASVAEGVAGMDAVICLFDSATLASVRDDAGRQPAIYQAVDALLIGLPRMDVDRLLLVADFAALSDQPTVTAVQQRLIAHPLRWTLIDADASSDDLSIEEFTNVSDCSPDDRRLQLRRIAAGIVDELESPQHIRQRVHFRLD